MYLHKRTYVRNSDHVKPEDRYQITILQGGKPAKIETERACEISEEVAYWRKANAIHEWFVRYVQDGNDNCADYLVSKDQLRELLERCRQVLKASELTDGEVTNGQQGKMIKDASTAEKLLPTQDGLFFGGTDYDESYLENIEYTKNVLEQLLAEEPSSVYYYSSSW